MDLEIGSHLYRNTNGVIEVEGVPQLTVSLKKPEGPPVVSFVQFDTVGRVTAKVVDSTMAFNERRALELTKPTNGLMLKNTETGKVVLKLSVNRPDRVSVTQGDFITIKGHALEITAVEWKVDKLRMGSGETDVNGGPVKLG
jgi:hypothetical protein